MIRKVALVFCALALFALLIVPMAGCPEDDDNGNGETPPPEDIKIGAIMDLTGALAFMGELISQSVQLAVDKINDAGGIDGAKIVLYIEDGKTDPAAGFEAVKKLHGVNGCKIIIGPMISGAVLAAGEYAAANNILLISPSATSPDIADQAWRTNAFRTCPSDLYQGAAIAQLVIEGGYQRVAIAVIDNQYGSGVADAVVAELAGTGVEIMDPITKYDGTKLDYLTELTLIQNWGPDCVVHTGYADDSSVLFKQAGQLGLDTIQWITSEGVYSDQTLLDAASAQFMADAVIGTAFTASGAAYDQFVADFVAEYGTEPMVYCDTVYDATMLALDAIDNVGATNITAVAAEVLRLADGYAGISGSVTLDALGDRIGGNFAVWEVVFDGAGAPGYNTIKVINLA